MTRMAPGEMDFTLLESRDQYALYFNHLSEVFSRLMTGYRRQAEGGDYEARIIHQYLQRMLTTVQALRMKYAHHPERQLKVDLTDSGFPSSLEIMGLQTDLQRRPEKLRELSPLTTLKRNVLDHMFREHEEPPELMWKLSQRAFLETLDPDCLLLPFTAGDIEAIDSRQSDTRTYVFSWACYDYTSSRPYIHIMTFDQDNGQEPLEARGDRYREFLALVEAEGSRAPDVGLLAMALDAGLASIHPKIIKRICVGPLYSRFLVQDPDVTRDPLARSLVGLLSEVSRNDDDFVVFFDDEMIFSKRQEVSNRALSLGGGVREIFFIPESDPESYARRASVFHRNVLLPHVILQHAARSGPDAIPGLEGCRKIAYTERGEIHGV